MTVLSVTEAAARGVAALVREADMGDVLVTRRGRPVAAVVSIERFDELRDLMLVMTRVLTDTGNRTGLDDAITALGFDRATLQAELDADLAAGRE